MARGKRNKGIFKSKGKIVKDLTKNIFKTLNSNQNKPLNYKQIAANLGLKDHNSKQQLLAKLEELKFQKKIIEIERGKYLLDATKNYHIGQLDVTKSGNAYFVCDDLEEDVFIHKNDLNSGLNGDTVKVYVYKRATKKKVEGEVVEIIERYKHHFVGTLQLSTSYGFVVPDDFSMSNDIFIPKEKIGNAENGDKVVAEITDWPSDSKNPFGIITRVLGKSGEHNTEIHAILAEYDLPYEFPSQVEEAAKALEIEITEDEIAKRRDLRDVLTFTIDPKDAKDFDDALSFQVLENGNYQIGIHIADVSHYVQEGSVLDNEAFERATSVYLVDRVVPMLPEMLSNGVCSLRPNEEKLTFSAIFEMNEKAELLHQWFGRTVTYSDKRFAYEEAQVIIENPEANPPTIPSEISLTGESYEVDTNIAKAILTLDSLAKKMRAKRLKSGALAFDKIETKFNLNEKSEPVGVFFKESKDANKLIEEFMLLANKKVAEFIGRTKSGQPKKTFIYRVHDEPNVDKLEALGNLVSKFGYAINTKSRISTSSSLNKLLKDAHGKAESNMIETLTIRSMSKAEYTTENIGHYGLAFDYYSHFTSPIRRYPDVMAHRLLQHYLDRGKSVSAEEYEEKCKHSSEMEMLASKAERDSIKYMQIKYMQNFTGKAFKGVISGVTEWGIYVEIIENKCEGMVRLRDITSDHFIFDPEEYALIGKRYGETYRLGDEVWIKVKNADLERKHLDFFLIED
ncbi:ribonuclease R [Ochrovirga pacifica]|uniref:ribonuclease R n=1 Tax=Ochrovirga pacifica TaxID=1042376 RepID=UPI0002559521|nr:ribonuclease R [Ochrovirga pacifica]